MGLTKDKYVLDMLSKIKHKAWELFVVSRVIHRLDDPEIEFVCQQLVRRSSSSRALTDMFFPQFGIHLEIDEPKHETDAHKKSDKRRTQDIVDATGHEVKRIKVKIDKEQMRTLKEIGDDVDNFVGCLRRLKQEKIKRGCFEPWDYERKFLPEPHIKRGYIDLFSKAVFRLQKDVLECFGYTGGNYQRGVWKIIDGSNRAVWFPRLYETDDWDNNLSDDGKVIVEKPKKESHDLSGEHDNWDSRIVFARYSDELGVVLYRFLGEFRFDEVNSVPNRRVFKRIANRVTLG